MYIYSQGLSTKWVHDLLDKLVQRRFVDLVVGTQGDHGEEGLPVHVVSLATQEERTLHVAEDEERGPVEDHVAAQD